MELIRVTKENLGQEHICCAIANESDCQVAAKKAWLAGRFADGLVFLKGNVRGKCFIEYLPVEHAWAPVLAEGYMYIDCLWVSGQYKGQGNSNLLLDACIEDSRAKGKHGLAILSADKKRPFLADPKYLAHKGFVLTDTAAPHFRLMALPFDGTGELPRFSESVKSPQPMQPGFTAYYAHQCPFTAKYVPILETMAREKAVPFRAIRFETAEQARQAPVPYTSFSLFYDGSFLTNEIPSEKRFAALLAEKGF